MAERLTRRGIIRLAGAAGGGAVLPVPSLQAQEPAPLAAGSGADEVAFLSAAVDRLIPPDPVWPGAVGAGVVAYIDRALAGAWGAGARLYTAGPWRDGAEQQGYQLPHVPAELYRRAIGLIGAWVGERYGGLPFERLAPEQQDEVLRALESGEAGFPDLPSATFFDLLRENTIEGYFGDPVHGGNRGMVGWRMIGFPGVYASWPTLVDAHGVLIDRPPLSIASSAHGRH